MGYMGGVVAASAAAREKERRQKRLHAEEEEHMTDYTRDDLASDWEFKIVRSETRAFRKPEVMGALVEEEAQAGWVMLEKFDDSRVRFKRSRAARARDAYLSEGVDPYRTRYGRAGASRAALISVLLGLVVSLGFGVMVLFVGEGLDLSSILAKFTGPTLFPLVILGLVVLLIPFFRMRRR